MRNSRGMTLIELIMIIAIGSALVAGVVKFTQQQIYNGSRMRDYLVALNLARIQMAKDNNTNYATLRGASVPPFWTDLGSESGGSFPGFILRRYIQSETTGATGVKIMQVDIKVDYAGGTFANPIVWLITYHKDHVFFGPGT